MRTGNRWLVVVSLSFVAACGSTQEQDGKSRLGGACEANADCEAPLVCEEGTCAAMPSCTCETGATSCDENTLRVCEDCNRLVEKEVCAGGCVDGACLTCICETGAVRCDDNDLVRCSDCYSWDLVDICELGCDTETNSCLE